MRFTKAQYEAFIQSDAWRVIRKRALDHYGAACQACGREDDLHVHHAIYHRFGGGELVTDLRILCQAHHTLVHQRHDLLSNSTKNLRATTDNVIAELRRAKARTERRAVPEHKRPPVRDWRDECRSIAGTIDPRGGDVR